MAWLQPHSIHTITQINNIHCVLILYQQSLMIFMVMNGLVNWHLDRVRLRHMNVHGLFYFVRNMFLNWVRNMFHYWIGNNLLNRDRDLCLNRNSYRLIDRNLNGIRLRDTNKNRLRYIDMDSLRYWHCHVLV